MGAETRPPIPAELERRIKLQSGHRCAVTGCDHIDIEIHHIVPWAACREHEFENLIALCPNCHTMAHNGKIDRKSLFAYKRALNSDKTTMAVRDLVFRKLASVLNIKFARDCRIDDDRGGHIVLDGHVQKDRRQVCLRIFNSEPYQLGAKFVASAQAKFFEQASSSFPEKTHLHLITAFAYREAADGVASSHSGGEWSAYRQTLFFDIGALEEEFAVNAVEADPL